MADEPTSDSTEGQARPPERRSSRAMKALRGRCGECEDGRLVATRVFRRSQRAVGAGITLLVVSGVATLLVVGVAVAANVALVGNASESAEEPLADLVGVLVPMMLLSAAWPVVVVILILAIAGAITGLVLIRRRTLRTCDACGHAVDRG